MRPPSERAGAIEGISWFFSEDRARGPRRKPFVLTYLGHDVVEVSGAGLFQNGTSATVDEQTARAFRGLTDWSVRDQPPLLEQ